jgi:VCBS repeat-containing protein
MICPNEPPVFQLPESEPDADIYTFDVLENSAVGSVVGSVVAEDSDGDTLEYSLSDGPFAIDTLTGEITVNGELDYESTPNYSLTVTVTDGHGNADTATLLINVNDVNEAPEFAGDSFNLDVDENSALDSPVGSVAANDTDSGDTLTYSLSAGPFAIDGATGAITVNAALDFETTPIYTLQVTVTDIGGQSDTATLTIQVNNVNEPPDFDTLWEPDEDYFDVEENKPYGELVGQLVVIDPDNGDTLTYSITAGNDDGAFAIDANGAITVADSTKLNFEATTTYTLSVKVTDNGGLDDICRVVITVTDVNEAPIGITLGGAGVPETTPPVTLAEIVNAANPKLVGILAATDPDASDSHTFTFAPGEGDDDNGSFQIVGDELRSSAVFDFETKDTYSVRIQATDSGGLTYETVVIVNVTNVNEAPEFDLPSYQFILSKDFLYNGQAAGSVSATDVDDGTTLSYSIQGGIVASDAFGYPQPFVNGLSIDDSGQITVADKAIVEQAFSANYLLQVTVTVTDGVLTDTVVVTIYEDHEPYLQKIDDYIARWRAATDNLVTDTYLNAKAAADQLAEFISGHIGAFTGTTSSLSNLTWASAAYANPPFAGTVSVSAVISQIMINAVADKIAEGHQAVVDRMHELMLTVRQRDRDDADQTMQDEFDARSQLVADIADDPQPIKTHKVVAHLNALKERLRINTHPPEIDNLYGKLLLTFAQAKGWVIQGSAWHHSNFGTYWYTWELGSPFLSAHDVVDELNAIHYGF